MKRYVPVLFASSALLLAACGGGGTPPAGGGPGPSPSPTPTPTQTPSTTNASGVVVDDANGNPLAGVKVALMPWGPCGATPAPATSITPQNDGCPTPLPSPQATTDASGNFALSGVANGHYLLVIGNDVAYTPPPGYAPPSGCSSNCPTPTPAPFTVQAVVHDNVTLTGGNQTLKAPTLPAVASITPHPWETNGDYRLATLDATTEMPCYIAWEYERAQHSLSYTGVDEWLTENTRAVNRETINNGGGSYTTLTINTVNVSGGVSCDGLMAASLADGNPYANNSRTLWFGGEYVPHNANFTAGARGIAEFPIDPRSNTDPNQPTWP